MNILFLMGRGIEGTGNTHWTIEMERYYKTLNRYDSVKTLANCVKKWGRRNSQDNDIFEENFDKNSLSDYITSDTTVIITSVPAKNDTDKTKETFTFFIETMHNDKTNKLIYLSVDHKINSINRNYYADEAYMNRFFDSLDIVCMHSFRNDFYSKFIVKRGLNSKQCKYIEFPMISVDVDELLPFYKPFNEKIDKTCHFIGRNTNWKGWMILRDIQHKYLKQLGYSSAIEGIELSIGYLHEIYKDIKVNRDLRDDIFKYVDTIDDSYINYGEDCSVYGPYIRNEALERVSKAKFAFFMTFLGYQYGGPMENTFLEDVSVGTVTVIRKELYECGEFINDNNEICCLNKFNPDDIGIILYDSVNPQLCIDKIVELENNEELYNTYRDRAIKFVKDNYNRKHVFDNLVYRLEHADEFAKEEKTDTQMSLWW